eukprot:Rhum_TRINITY_DN4262_c0_g1::Rhum_TRINITY_DN4262_c0_g1_i1::g.13613::m.13613
MSYPPPGQPAAGGYAAPPPGAYGQPPQGQQPPYGQPPAGYPGQPGYGQPAYPGQQPPPGQAPPTQPPQGQQPGYNQPPAYGQPPGQPAAYGQQPQMGYTQPGYAPPAQAPPQQAPPAPQQGGYPPQAQPQPQAQQASLQQWFAHVDKDRSGKVDFKELQEALRQGGLNFSIMSCNMLLRLFDNERTGKVNFKDFCSLYQWVHTRQQSFYHFDTDRSGSLDIAETHNALTQAGYQLDQHAFCAAVKAYDPDQNAQMSMTEFVGLCAYLQLATNTFISFDSQRTGSITLSLNQFIYASSQCK